METKQVAGLVAAFVLIFALGIFAGTKLKSKTGAPAGKENTFQAGWNAAKEQLEKVGVGIAPTEMEIKTLTGTVDKIDGDIVTLKNVFSSLDPLADPDLAVRVVQTTKDTKFYELKQKESVQFQKEIEEFQEKMKQQAENKDTVSLVPPNPQEKKEIALADIKIGQLISVISNENIRDKKEFTATEISVQFMPEASLAGKNSQSSLPPPITPPSGDSKPSMLPPPITPPSGDSKPSMLPPPIK